MGLFSPKPSQPKPDKASFTLRGRHAKPITPINDNPDMTDAQRDQLAADVALFDSLEKNDE